MSGRRFASRRSSTITAAGVRDANEPDLVVVEPGSLDGLATCRRPAARAVEARRWLTLLIASDLPARRNDRIAAASSGVPPRNRW